MPAECRGEREAHYLTGAMVCIRPATVDDLLAMQRCNLLCLPENYQLKVCLASVCFSGGAMRWS